MLTAKAKILDEAKSRVSKLEPGQPVTNVCAGPDNPRRHSGFVEHKIVPRKNRYGVVHSSHYARCGNGRGEQWDTDITVVFPGHLSVEECEKLYAPIWEAEFGTLTTQ